MSENIEPTDLLRAEEVPLPGVELAEITPLDLASLADLKATLESNERILEAAISAAVDERSRLNAQLAEDRAELTRRAEERRLELNDGIKQSRELLKETQRMLAATQPKKKRAKNA